MSVDLGSVSGTKKQSIARVELNTQAAIPQVRWSLVFHFEDGVYDASGALAGDTVFGTARVERLFGDVMNDVIDDGAGHTATVAQLAAWIKAAAYKYRQADVDAAAKALKTVNQRGKE